MWHFHFSNLMPSLLFLNSKVVGGGHFELEALLKKMVHFRWNQVLHRVSFLTYPCKVKATLLLPAMWDSWWMSWRNGTLWSKRCSTAEQPVRNSATPYELRRLWTTWIQMSQVSLLPVAVARCVSSTQLCSSLPLAVSAALCFLVFATFLWIH